MKKIIYIMFLFSIAACCKQDDNDSVILPDCIQQIIDKSSVQAILSVQRQKVDGEYHYWLNTGASAWDGIEYIVNDNCETVCNITIRPYDECLNEYDFDKWEIVWKVE